MLENRFAAEQYERFNKLASELVGLKVDVLVAVTRPAALAAQRATTTIPIVFTLVPDPVASSECVQQQTRDWRTGTGILQIVGAIRLRKEIENEWLLIAGGVLSVIFGLILVVQPGTGALALLYVIGIYAILYGILEIWLSLRLRNHATS